MLIREALQRGEKVAVAKFALRGRERLGLGLLSIKEDALVLHSMHGADELRDPSSLAPKPVEIGVPGRSDRRSVRNRPLGGQYVHLVGDRGRPHARRGTEWVPGWDEQPGGTARLQGSMAYNSFDARENGWSKVVLHPNGAAA
jgi:hypothetical protein